MKVAVNNPLLGTATRAPDGAPSKRFEGTGNESAAQIKAREFAERKKKEQLAKLAESGPNYNSYQKKRTKRMNDNLEWM